jgi:serine/threonine protein phosphatase PrpC
MKFIIHSFSTTGNYKSSNEDTLDIINGLENLNQTTSEYVPVLYAGLFDGHGGDGISKSLVDPEKINIGKYFTLKKSSIAKSLSQSKKYNDKIIIPLFEHIQEKLKNYFRQSNTMGSTALITLIFPKPASEKLALKIINLGDSRAVIANEYNIGNALNLDHKPHLFCDIQRIQQLGGTIEYTEGDDPRINGMSVSRSFGDLDNSYISQIPNIYDYNIGSDKFIIMGCDGVWDVLSNQDAVD